MKITPIVHRPPQARPLPSPTGTQPFATYMSGANLDLAEVSQGRALGFEEVGVFGLARSTASTPREPTSPAGGGPAGDAQPLSALPLARDEAATDRAAAEPYGRSLQPRERAAATFLPDSLYVRAGPIAETPIPQVSTAQRLMARVVAGKPASGQGPEAVKALEVRCRAAVNGPPGSVIVTLNPDGTIQIIAAAPNLASQDARALRRLAFRLAAEYGLTLSGLSLNGVDLPAPRQTPDRSS